MDTGFRFTDGRVPDSAIRTLYGDEHRWQRWLDVEAALALAEAKVGIIPTAAGTAIAEAADISQLDVESIRTGILQTSHPIMALVSELSAAVEEPYGGWVHWGATTRNIIQTGDALILRECHEVFLDLLADVFETLEQLADQGAAMPCAGRTHGQHAVPITFGFKAGVWIDELGRHLERLRQVEPRVFVAMLGGAVGNYASLGSKGPKVQALIAEQLNLESMRVPARSVNDSLAEYMCILGMLAGTSGKIAKQVFVLMQPEFDEAVEPIPEGTIGSSTMPHKRNPQLADDCITIAAEIRALIPLALEGMLHEHEVSCGQEIMMDDAIRQACILTGDLLVRLKVILGGLELRPQRMRHNLELSGGLISSEAVMLALGETLGRQTAHEIIYEAAQAVARGTATFQEVLAADPRIADHLPPAKVQQLLDTSTHLGLSAQIAHDMAREARHWTRQLRHRKGASVLSAHV